jgi:predicted nucleic acid-binding protein
VKSLLDTSVLVASFYGDHEHHASSIALLARQKPMTGCTAAHCLCEFYSVVTGMPGKDRATPDEALLFLRDLGDHLTLVSLDASDYPAILEVSAACGVTGGATYDALIAKCASKARATVIYTWNVKHFQRLSSTLSVMVKQP